MSEKDPELGKLVHEHLKKNNVETPMTDNNALTNIQREVKLAEATRDMVASLGLNMDDDSIKGTPARITKMYAKEIFYGLDYRNFPKCSVFENKMGYDEMVAVHCTVMSVCEHHFVPFVGTANVAYIPGTKVIGLSKFNRVVDFFARRPQVQERLTEQIHAALCFILGTYDVAVVIKAEHMCVKLRGVKDDSYTVTSRLRGKFKENDALRNEFLALTR